MGKAWKLSKGKFAYITSRGKRGIASSLAAAKSKAGVSRSKTKKTSRSGRKKSSAGGGKKKMSRKMTWPLTIVFGLLGIPLVAPQASWKSVYGAWQAGEAEDIPRIGIRTLTGFDMLGIEKWTLPRGLAMLVAAAIAHKIASAVGINRMLGRAKIPFVRI